MAESPDSGFDGGLLAGLENLGDGAAFAGQIFDLAGRSQFFGDFSHDDIALLGGYLRVYRAQPGQTIIREGDFGDYMLLVIRGEVDVYKVNPLGEQQFLSAVTAGMTLGEMSMIDGEPRFATCIAMNETTFGVLSRDNMGKIIVETPSLGAKILIRLVTMLSQRLRQTSAMLVQYMK